MKITVFGAGAWGTALAVSAATRHEVALWARDAGRAAPPRHAREPALFAPVPLPATLTSLPGRPNRLRALPPPATSQSSPPMAGLRQMLWHLREHGGPGPTCRALKAYRTVTGCLAMNQARSPRPGRRLSGPSFAESGAQAPTALVAARTGQVRTAAAAAPRRHAAHSPMTTCRQRSARREERSAITAGRATV
jgi:glycerol-3-phosphate dehydrogenase (NAD(P)+)